MRKALYILAELEDSDIIWMARAASLRRLTPGELLIEAGTAVTNLYFVIEGTLEVTGRSGTHLARLELGDVVGEMSFVEKRVPDASVQAQRSTELLAIPHTVMLDAFERDHGLAMRFYRALAVFLSDRLRAMSGVDEQELDEGLLDNVQQAGERFIRLIDLNRGAAAP